MLDVAILDRHRHVVGDPNGFSSFEAVVWLNLELSPSFSCFKLNT